MYSVDLVPLIRIMLVNYYARIKCKILWILHIYRLFSSWFSISVRKYDGHIDSYAEYYANKIAPDLAEFQSQYINQKFKEAAAVEVSYNMASLIGGVVFGIPTSDAGLFNRLAAVNYLLSHATSRYIDNIKMDTVPEQYLTLWVFQIYVEIVKMHI